MRVAALRRGHSGYTEVGHLPAVERPKTNSATARRGDERPVTRSIGPLFEACPVFASSLQTASLGQPSSQRTRPCAAP